MKEDRDYIQDLTEIRSMMERSSKFLSLSGWAGIMAGIYALAGAFTSYYFFNFNPDRIHYNPADVNISGVILLAFIILLLALSTAVFFSYKKSRKNGENIWNPTSKRLMFSISIPLSTGAILMLILLTKNLIGLIPPLTLLFYGLALYNAGKFTIDEVKYLGFAQIILGLISSFFVEYGLIFWAIGFGIAHIIYGIYMHFRYER